LLTEKRQSKTHTYEPRGKGAGQPESRNLRETLRSQLNRYFLKKYNRPTIRGTLNKKRAGEGKRVVIETFNSLILNKGVGKVRETRENAGEGRLKESKCAQSAKRE